MIYNMDGNQDLSLEGIKKQEAIEFYALLFEKLLKQQKETYGSLTDFPITTDVCDTILKFASQTFESVLDILETGIQLNPVLGVNEDRTSMQRQLFEEAIAYLKNNLE